MKRLPVCNKFKIHNEYLSFCFHTSHTSLTLTSFFILKFIALSTRQKVQQIRFFLESSSQLVSLTKIEGFTNIICTNTNTTRRFFLSFFP